MTKCTGVIDASALGNVHELTIRGCTGLTDAYPLRHVELLHLDYELQQTIYSSMCDVPCDTWPSFPAGVLIQQFNNLSAIDDHEVDFGNMQLFAPNSADENMPVENVFELADAADTYFRHINDDEQEFDGPLSPPPRADNADAADADVASADAVIYWDDGSLAPGFTTPADDAP